MTAAADLVKQTSTEELREIANVIASTPLPAEMGAVVDSLLELVIEGRSEREEDAGVPYLEAAADACHTMTGWTDSAVRAYDYQEAEKWLRALAGAGSREENE